MLYIILCAYNEEKAIASVLDQARQLFLEVPLEVFLINDGSHDQTGAIAQSYNQRLPLKLISHEQNWGLGKSLIQAFSLVLNQAKPHDFVATLDADQTHSAMFIQTMIQTLEKTRAGMAIASRFVLGGQEMGMPALRRWITPMARRLFSWRFPNIGSIKDSTSGFRCYRVSALEHLRRGDGTIKLKQKGFAIQMEILLFLRRQGCETIELPYPLDYTKKQSQSGFRFFKALKEYIPLWVFGATL